MKMGMVVTEGMGIVTDPGCIEFKFLEIKKIEYGKSDS
jgi:hypothetical protein